MIVKIQLPLYYNHDNPTALIYNEDKSIYLHVPVEEVELIMEGRPKVYFYADVSKSRHPGNLIINGEAPSQLW
jgi:hypothetical protein